MRSRREATIPSRGGSRRIASLAGLRRAGNLLAVRRFPALDLGRAALSPPRKADVEVGLALNAWFERTRCARERHPKPAAGLGAPPRVHALVGFRHRARPAAHGSSRDASAPVATLPNRGLRCCLPRRSAAISWLFAACLCAGLLPALAASQYRAALPGYRYEFPRDHFDHPDFQTEWWYYTGNLRSSDGRRFGFELTFFRQAVSREKSPDGSPWAVRDVYLAHFAISDIDGQDFVHEERMNRAGPGIAGASASAGRIWNGNWEVRWEGERQRLRAIAATFALELSLDPAKPPVVHGRQGVSQKAAGEGRASHYVSLTRIRADGVLEIEGRRHTVTGTAWMDHEFFTHQLEADQSGWDWFSVQLEDETELMLFRLRRRDGSVDPFSAGTFVDRDGTSRHLEASEFTLRPLERRWRSPRTGADYPIAWRIEVASLGLALEVRTPLDKQEIVTRGQVIPNYWEGAIELQGQRQGRPIRGVGYLEMTGYDRSVKIGK